MLLKHARSFLSKLPKALSPQRSLMARLVGSFLTVSVLTVIFVALVAFFEARYALREAMTDRLAGVALEKEGELNRWVDLQRNSVVFLAELPGLRRDAAALDSDPHPQAQERIEALFRAAMGSRTNLESLCLLSPVGGRVIAASRPAMLGEHHVHELFYARGKTETFVQNVNTSPITGKPAFTIATPVRNDAGETVAVLAGELDLGYIDRLTAIRAGLGQTGEAYLVTPSNDFVSSARFGRDELRRGVFSAGIDAALEGAQGAGVYENYAGVPVLGAYRWNSARELALLVEMEQAEAFAPARRLVVTILGIGLLSALVLAGCVYWIARQIARPVLAITKAATAVAEGDFTTVAPVMTSDEVGVLAEAFNEMTSRLQRLYTDLSEHVETTTRSVVELEKSQYLLQAIIDNSATLIAVTDPQDRFLLLNRSFENLLGVPQAEALGRPPQTFLAPDVANSYLKTIRTAWAQRRVVEQELSFHIHGETRTYFLVAFPLRTAPDEPYGVGVVGTDLTDVKRAQEAHQHLEAQVQHAQKLESLGLMAGGVAHDFNNILTSLLGNTELAMKFTRAGSQAAPYLDKVVAATKQASNLTNQMLAYAGKASFHQETLELNAVVEEMSELLRASIEKTIEFRSELTSRPTTIKANRTQVSQLIMNLVTNAAEAVGDRPGWVNVRTNRSNTEPDTVWLTVCDNGAGMDEETHDRIFDPFFSTKGPGRGLGLAAVQGIVKSAGGKLAVTSTRGDGSVFEVQFPAAQEASVGQSTPPRGYLPRGNGTILVVDDEPTVRAIARDLLETAGFSVIEASTGGEAVKLYESSHGAIDAVLLDMTMPGISGAEALAEIRAIDDDARVILTSGYDGEDTLAESKDTGGVEFLQKPYAASTLLSKISTVLATPARSR